VRAAKVAEVPSGTKKTVDIGGTAILICNSNDRLYAIANLCSHAAEKLECGRMSQSWIACPLHGARFELATGRAMNPPAVRPIKTFAIRTVDDWIEIAV
jgi:3-phenylpropionate/trans-cinnamate dioxygenase ferredoxin component